MDTATDSATATPRRGAFLARLTLRNYKSIAACEVKLNHFTAFVGPNGAGKSNLLDSLRFVADALRNNLVYALGCRGGVNEVRRRSGGHPTHFSIRLDLNLPDGSLAVFAFKVRSAPRGAFAVQREKCWIQPANLASRPVKYEVRDGRLAGESQDLPTLIERDRLYLGLVSGLPAFRPVYDALTRMGFYNLNPARIREPQDPSPEELLLREGQNLTTVLGRLRNAEPSVKRRIEQYLEAIVPGLKGIEVKSLAPKETVEFRQEVGQTPHPWKFAAANMSDGTLRVLGILVALFQGAALPSKRVSLIGIEEPEAALHPGASGALVEAILEATHRTQVLVTSHSPDLLDNPEIRSDNILAVVADRGETIIGEIDEASRQALREGLYTAGELLRIQQIEPDRRKAQQSSQQLDLFATEPRP